ncbi:unnamed protein product [Timema podura]|uniref:Cytochrome P450 n=1 Tax=Timema podura TaxID=61482 RepID=A0ABN7PAH8_TIMPD|nr:unnamed protein product [Timema podura]
MIGTGDTGRMTGTGDTGRMTETCDTGRTTGTGDTGRTTGTGDNGRMTERMVEDGDSGKVTTSYNRGVATNGISMADGIRGEWKPVLCSFKHTDKIHFYKFLHNFLGEGLITSSGEKWQTHRKLIQPAFSQGVLESFLESFHKSSQRLARSSVVSFDLCYSTVLSFDLCYSTVVSFDLCYNVVLGVTAEEDQHKDGDSPFRK